MSEALSVTTAVMSLVGTGTQAYGQYTAGQDYQAASNYNAALQQQRAQAIDVRKGLTDEQFARIYSRLEGESVSAVAGSGYDYSGSFLEVVNDTLTQVELDRQIAIYNLELEKNQALSHAEELRYQGDVMARSGKVDALSTLLTQGNEWYQKYGGFSQPTFPLEGTRPSGVAGPSGPFGGWYG
jgi:hypothetical protein